MPCVAPPELSDGDLTAFIDGEADVGVVSHMARCPHCRARADELGALQARYTVALLRSTCPSPQELGEYNLGLLPRDRFASVRNHVSGCVRCADELEQLGQFLAELAPDLDRDPIRQIKVIVAELVRGARDGFLSSPGPSLAPALSGVRGANAGTRTYRAGDLVVAIDISQVESRPQGFDILGLLTGSGYEHMRVRLLKSGEAVATSEVDELGSFSFWGLGAGTYDLILAATDIEIRIPDLEV